MLFKRIIPVLFLLIAMNLVADRAFAQCTAGYNFQLIDDANTPNVTSDCITLTTDATGKRGCAWDVNSTLDFTTDFSYDFRIILGSNDGGADGMCFVIQNDPAGRCACGSVGGAMGAGGITKSLIIEIDTYINTEDRDDGLPAITCTAGPDEDHMDMWTNGNINPNSGSCPSGGRPYLASAVPLKNGAAYYNIENGNYHLFRVSWTASTQIITAKILDLTGTTTYGTISSKAIVPATLFGTNNPFFGFTASTGGLSNEQGFCLPAQLAVPIELLSFKGNYTTDNKANINWTVVNTDNISYYVVESSNDGMVWKAVKKEVVRLNSQSTPQTYTVTDEKPYKPITYYRLKSVDYNGKSDYSYIISINVNNDVSAMIKSVYPMPANNSFQFTCGNALITDEPITVTLYDAVGIKVLEKQYDYSTEGTTYSLALDGVKNGMYQAVFSQGNLKQVNKLSVLK